jgi:hypothetical protein
MQCERYVWPWPKYPVVPGRGRDGPGESGYAVHGGTGNDHPRVAPRPC